MILDDPGLEGVAAIVFDEYHERSLDADLGLALALDAAHAAAGPAAPRHVGDSRRRPRRRGCSRDAPVIESQGRAFPVETRYLGRNLGPDANERIEDAGRPAPMLRGAWPRRPARSSSSCRARAKSLRVAERLAARDLGPNRIVAPLYRGDGPPGTGRGGVLPAPAGLAQDRAGDGSIAETSLTIEGVRVVVDSGLARVPVYEPALGLTRLETRRASRAAADQRRGRAGRTEPGICYRLWDEAGTGALEPFARPAILSADLSGLLLDCAAWGARRPERDLAWLDPPPAPALAEARAMLAAIGALDADGGLTDAGRKIRALALPPRLARMVVLAAADGDAGMAAQIATIIVERGLGGDAADLRERLTRFRRDRGPRADDARALAQTFARQAGARGERGGDVTDAGRLLALAFPDRIAKARGKAGEFLMANGRAAAVAPHDALAGAPYLAIAEVTGRAGAARILLAAPLDEAEIAAVVGANIAEAVTLEFDPGRAALQARRSRRLGALVLAEATLPVPAGEATATALAAGLATLGMVRLPWTAAQTQLRDRVALVRSAAPDDWPDLSDAALAADGAAWLAPFLDGATNLADIDAGRLDAALAALLPWDKTRRLDEIAPTAFTTPAGAQHRLDYAAEQGPTLSVRVQELYGLAAHPTVAGVPLVLELLSPAGRPIQVTRDLPGFWAGSWRDVRGDMRGRYPKHPWPEDPAAALPTLRAKPRGT